MGVIFKKLIKFSDKTSCFRVWYNYGDYLFKRENMKLIVKLLLTAFAVLVLSNLLSGIVVENYVTAVIIALVLAVLNTFIRPILVVLTLPITIVTLGLFLLVINAIIILIAGNLVSGFYVNGFFTALIFSVLLSIFRSVLFGLIKEEE